MLIYEKFVNGVRKLYGTHANVPADNDAELKYKDIDGDVLTLVDGDTYLDDKAGGIIRQSDEKFVGVFIGDETTAIIPKDFQPEVKEVKSIKVTTKPTKLTYTKGETFDKTGSVVTATYSDGDTADVTANCTFAPAHGEVLNTAGEITVNVSFSGKSTTFKITVNEAAAV